MEYIGEERSCEVCEATPAFEYRPRCFRCDRHLTRALLGVIGAGAASALGGLWLDPVEPVPNATARASNLLRLMPITERKLALDKHTSDQVDLEEILANAEFDDDGELVGFGKSEPTLRLVRDESGAEAEGSEEEPDAERPEFSEAMKQLGVVIWDMQMHRLKKALKLAEPGDFEARKIAEYIEKGRLDWAATYLRSFLLRVDNDPDRVPDSMRPGLEYWADEVALAPVTVDSASTPELAELYLKHERSRLDLIAAALFWVRITDEELREERRAQFERRCVSPILLRLGRQFFEEFREEPVVYEF